MTLNQFRFESYGASNEGCVRELNEDRYVMVPASGTWVVADGMGGHEAGELASSNIVSHVETIGKSSSATDLQARFVDRIHRANSDIRQMSRERNGATIGATVVGLLIFGGEYACLWSGDSRIYRMRKGELEQLTRDHTEVQELLDRNMITPEEAETWPRKNVITRAVGVMEDPGLDMTNGMVLTGDTFVLCSDGLTAHLNDDDIAEIVHGHKAQMACEKLIETTLERGASDNVTVIIVQCRDVNATVPLQSLQEA